MVLEQGSHRWNMVKCSQKWNWMIRYKSSLSLSLSTPLSNPPLHDSHRRSLILPSLTLLSTTLPTFTPLHLSSDEHHRGSWKSRKSLLMPVIRQKKLQKKLKWNVRKIRDRPWKTDQCVRVFGISLPSLINLSIMQQNQFSTSIGLDNL